MIAFVAFSLKRAWQGFWRNSLMSLAATASMVLMLTLLSGLVILLAGLDATLKYVESEVEVVAYLKDSATAQDVAQLTTDLKAMPQVTTVAYISKDQALKNFQERQPEVAKLVDSLPSNPLPASFEISLRDPGDYIDVATYLRGQGAVDSVQDIKKTVSQMISVINVLRTGGIAVLAIVGLTVLFIIVNTIRLAVVARAEEIEIMRLVGASDAFIRWPFIFEGALVGFFGAAITIGLLLLVQAPLASLLSDFFNVLPVQASAMVGQNVALIVMATGVGIGVVGSYVSVRSYLAR
ncbi:MAG: permease-like cell division protein FtsX [Candidatus Limnocylindrales bacterium]